MFSNLFAVFFSELTLLNRRRQEWATPLVFALMVCTLFAFAVSPDPAKLQIVAPGVVWVAITLATLLTLDGMFRQDFDEGVLEQVGFGGFSFLQIALMKSLSHWLFIGLPLVLASPLYATMLAMPANGIKALFLSLLIGTPALFLIGAIGGALTLTLRRGGLIAPILILPFFIPILIFGSSTAIAAIDELPYAGHLALLGALNCMALVLAPIACSFALRVSIDLD